MTVITNLSTWGPYFGNDVTNSFPFTGKIFAAYHLRVTKKNITTYAEVELVLSSGTTPGDYTVSGVNNVNGGNVILFIPLATGYSLLIERIVPIVQLTDIVNQGAFHSQIHEDVFDYHTMVDQQLSAAIPIIENSVPGQYVIANPNGDGTYLTVGVAIPSGGLTSSLIGDRVTFATDPTHLVTAAELTWSDSLKQLGVGVSFLSGSAANISPVLSSPANTLNRTPNYFRYFNPGNHPNQLHTAVAISNQPWGSGTNGPPSLDAGLTVSNLKQNFDGFTIVGGEVSGIYTFVRNGSFGDTDGLLVDVATYNNGGFSNVLEGINRQVNGSGVVVNDIDVQLGVINPNAGIRIGLVMTPLTGFGTSGVYLGGTWFNGLDLTPANITGSALALGVNQVISWRDSSGLSNPAIVGTVDNIISIGWGSLTPTNGHVDIRGGGQGLARFSAGILGSNQTPLFLLYHNGSTVAFQQVTVGDPNSASGGRRVLCVPN